VLPYAIHMPCWEVRRQQISDSRKQEVWNIKYLLQTNKSAGACLNVFGKRTRKRLIEKSADASRLLRPLAVDKTAG